MIKRFKVENFKEETGLRLSPCSSLTLRKAGLLT